MDTVAGCSRVGGTAWEQATAEGGGTPNQGVQATAASLRSCVAAASSGA